MLGAARSALGRAAMSTRSQDPAAVPLAGSSGLQQRRFAARSADRAASPEGVGNKGSDNEDVDEETEVKNFKYWANKIGHVFKKVRQTKKRRKSSYGSLFSSLGVPPTRTKERAHERKHCPTSTIAGAGSRGNTRGCEEKHGSMEN